MPPPPFAIFFCQHTYCKNVYRDGGVILSRICWGPGAPLPFSRPQPPPPPPPPRPEIGWKVGGSQRMARCYAPPVVMVWDGRGGGGSRVRAAARATDWVSSVLCSHVAPLVCDSLHDPCWITRDRHCAGSYGAIWLCACPLESHIVLFLRPDAPVWSHPRRLM